MTTWSDITIQPEEPALAALRTSWRWMLGDAWTPLLFSAIGDVFFEVPAGTVWWLSTATGSLEQVAESLEQTSANYSAQTRLTNGSCRAS